jgi:hypothetical protein
MTSDSSGSLFFVNDEVHDERARAEQRKQDALQCDLASLPPLPLDSGGYGATWLLRGSKRAEGNRHGDQVHLDHRHVDDAGWR